MPGRTNDARSSHGGPLNFQPSIVTRNTGLSKAPSMTMAGVSASAWRTRSRSGASAAGVTAWASSVPRIRTAAIVPLDARQFSAAGLGWIGATGEQLGDGLADFFARLRL